MNEVISTLDPKAYEIKKRDFNMKIPKLDIREGKQVGWIPLHIGRQRIII